MNKKVINVFGRNQYLLGEDKDGIRYYLEEPKFDCGWYWGGLYVETFTNNRQPTRSVDISSHSHVDSMFFNKPGKSCWDVFKEFFKDCVLNEKEIYKFFEYARTFYTLKSVAGVYYTGGSHITHNDCYDVLKSDQNWERVVKVELPAVIAEILKLLGGTKTPEDFVNSMCIYN